MTDNFPVAVIPYIYLKCLIMNASTGTNSTGTSDDFDFDILNFTFLMVTLPRRSSYGVYISLLIIWDFNSSNATDKKSTLSTI